MITLITQNQISNTHKSGITKNVNGVSAINQMSVCDSFSVQQLSFTGSNLPKAKNAFNKFISKLFAATLKQTMEDGTVITSKAFRNGIKYKETRVHPSGLKMKFYLEPDGQTVAKIKKYENFNELRETFWLEKGVQTSAQRYLDSGICEEFKFYGFNNTQCKYQKFSISQEKQEICLNLPEPPLTGTLPDIKNILPMKHAEILNYKVKSCDLEDFKKEAQESVLIEGPMYKSLKEFIDGLKYKTYAIGNLKLKGYNVSLPKEEDPKAILDIYIFLKKEAADHYNDTFVNNNSKLNAVANRKSQDFAREFDKLVGGTEGRPYDRDAEDLLAKTAYARQYQKGFDYFLDKFYIRTINYKGKNDFLT